MTTNLIALASQYLTPEVLGKISSTLGIDRTLIGKACAAAVPALFGQFANAANTPDGARKIFDAATQQGTSVLDTIRGGLGGNGMKSMMENGTSVLSSILGGSSVSSLSSMIGKFAGLGQSSASSILGFVAPLLMGVLGKHVAQEGLDASGLAKLLTAQKENITAAMPSGFKDIMQTMGTAQSAVREQGARVYSTASSKFPARTPQNGSSLRTALTWILPLLALGILSWWIFSNQERAVQQAKKENPPENLVVAGVDLKTATQNALNSVNSTLQDIKDEASAKAAVPRLQSAATELDTIIRLSDSLPSSSKSAVANMVGAAQPATTQLFDRVLQIPGVQAAAQPQIEALRSKLEALSKSGVATVKTG